MMWHYFIGQTEHVYQVYITLNGNIDKETAYANEI